MSIESWVSMFLNHQTENEKMDEYRKKREIEQQYQIANEAREPAIQAALLKAKADALRDIQTKNNQQDYYNQGFGQWSQLANRGINNAAQLSAMTGGNVDVNSQNQLLQNLAQIQQGIPESSTRLTASQQRFGNDMWGQLNRLGAGERQANAQNAQTQNELDTANYIRSNGLPYLRAQNERIQREGANTLVPVQNALELQQANNELLKQQGYGTDPARLTAIGNAQANRERIHNLTGHWPEDVYKSPILPKFDEQGNVVPQDNSQLYSRALGTELGAQQAAKMDAFMGGNPIDNQVEKAGGVRLMPTVSAGGNVVNPATVRKPVSGSNIHPLDSKSGSKIPEVNPAVKQVYKQFDNIIRNYTKDMSPLDASDVRNRVQESVYEETMNYLGLSPSSIGSSIFYQSAEKTLKDAAKDPAMAQKIHNIPAEVQEAILRKALLQSGIQ